MENKAEQQDSRQQKTGNYYEKREDYSMSRLEDMVKMEKINELLGRKEEPEKKSCTLLWVLAVIGAVAAIAGIAYAVYRYFTPDYLEDFEDDFEDDFEEDFFEDEEQEAPAAAPAAADTTAEAEKK